MTDFASLPIAVIPASSNKDPKQEFVDKLKGKGVKVCSTVAVGATFSICNTATQDIMQFYKSGNNRWMVWGSVGISNLTDIQLEDFLWKEYESANEGKHLRITDEFGCMTWEI